MSLTFFEVSQRFLAAADRGAPFLQPCFHQLLRSLTATRFSSVENADTLPTSGGRYSNVQVLCSATQTHPSICFRAFDSVTGTVVFLRSFTEKPSDEIESLVRSLRGLGCPELPTVYETDVTTQTLGEAHGPLMVEQFIDGVPLNELLVSRELEPQTHAALFWSLLTSAVIALRVLHQHELSSLSLDTNHILVDQFGRFYFTGITSLTPATAQTMLRDTSTLIALLKQIAHSSSDHDIARYVIWVDGLRDCITPPSLLLNKAAAPHIFDAIDHAQLLQDAVCPELVRLSRSTELLAFILKLGTLLMESRIVGYCDKVLEALASWDCLDTEDMVAKAQMLKSKIDAHSDERLILAVSDGTVSPSFREIGHILDKIDALFAKSLRSD